jgi:hypothetical protein
LRAFRAPPIAYVNNRQRSPDGEIGVCNDYFLACFRLPSTHLPAIINLLISFTLTIASTPDARRVRMPISAISILILGHFHYLHYYAFSRLFYG